MGSRARRIASAWGQLRELADFSRLDPRWWVVAAAAGMAPTVEDSDARYLASNGEPASDTFIAVVGAGAPLVGSTAVAAARAAQRTLRHLHGRFEQQPLASWVARTASGSVTMVANPLSEVAFAVGARVWVGQLSERPDAASDAALANALVREQLEPLALHHRPFVTIVVGISPSDELRHLHRRGWHAEGGPFVGIGVHADWLVCSTCHIAVDGYGHALIAQHLASAVAQIKPAAPTSKPAPALPPMPETAPLGMAWRTAAAPAPRALEIAYATGGVLQQRLPHENITMQLPVALPLHGRHGRVVPALLRARPEPFAAFAERGKRAIEATRNNTAVMTGLMNFARAAPMPSRWKRSNVAAPPQGAIARPVATALAGRACVSVIRINPADRVASTVGPMIAVSAPALPATAADPTGGIVVTVIDDGTATTMTVCGTGIAATDTYASELIDEISARLHPTFR